MTACWIWPGSHSRGGYGTIRARPTPAPLAVHRVVYEGLVGPIPDGLELDHLCRTPACANPRHLEPVTHRTNVLRGTSPAAVNASQTACIRGHAFDARNTLVKRRGARDCRECHRIGEAARLAALRVAS